jgi:alpha-L-fucosidase
LPAALPGTAAADPQCERYEPNWPSVDRHTPAPEWFQDAKWTDDGSPNLRRQFQVA